MQELIDALPEAGDITADHAEEVKAQLSAIDEALAALTEEERTQADTGRYTAAAEALAALTKEPDNAASDTQTDLTKEDDTAAANAQTDLTKENNNAAANTQTSPEQKPGPEKTGGIQNYTVGDPKSGVGKTAAGTNAADDISLSPERLDFGTWEVSEERPAAQTVTLTNTGSQSVEVSLGGNITSYYITPGEGFDEKGQITLAPNATAQFSVQPKEGLKPGTVGTGMYFQCRYPGEQGRLKQLLFSLDVVCTKHGYGEWTIDDKNHSRVCQYCSAEEKGDHTFEDGRCTVCGFQFIASVSVDGEEPAYYTDIQEAFTAANAGTAESPATITLLADAQVPDGESISVTGNVILESSGNYTISGSCVDNDTTIPSGLICVHNRGRLTIKSGTIKNVSNDDNFASHCINLTVGTLALEGGTILMEYSGENAFNEGVYAGDASTVIIRSGTIRCTASGGGSAYGLSIYNGADVTITGGVIEAAASGDPDQSYGLCIYSSDRVSITGGTFTGNTSAVYCADREPVSKLLGEGYIYLDDAGAFAAGVNSTEVSLPGGAYTVKKCTDHVYGDEGKCTACGAQAVVGVESGTETTYYENIEDAWNAAKGKADGATVILFANVSTDGTGLTVADGDNITLDSEPGGSVCALNLGNDELTVTGGSFTLANVDLQSGNSCIAVQGGSVSIEGGSVSGYHGMYVTGGSVEVSGGTVSGREGGSGISIENGAVRILDGASIKDGYYGIMVSTDCTEGSLAVLGGKIAAQSVALRIQSSGCDVTLSGGTFTVDYQNDIISCIGAGRSVGSLLAGGYAYKRDGAWVNDASESYFGATSESKTVTVEKVPVQGVTVTADKTSLTYGDAAPTLTATVAQPEGITGEITCQWYQDGVEITGATEATYTPGRLNAGNYNYTCKAMVDGYSLTSTEVEVKVEQKELELAITGTTTKTYDGTTDGPAGLSIETKNRVSGDDVTATAASYTYNSANVPEANTITAGSVTLSGDDANNYKLPEGSVTIGGTITKSTPVITFLDYSITKTYSGEALNYQFINHITVDGASVEDIVFSWKDSEGKTLDSAPVNAGTYTIIATIAETKNTAEATNSIQVYISTRIVSDPTITLEKDSYEYDGTEKMPTVTVFDGETEIDPNEYTVTYSNNTDVGTATVTIKDNEDGNYEIYESTASFQITKPDLSTATVTLALPDGGYTYDGTAKMPAVTVVKNGQTVDASEYSVSYSNTNGGDGNHTNAGTVTVTITVTADGNYSGSTQATFEVARKPVAAVVTAQNKTYDGNTNAVVKAEVTEGLVDGDSITITGLKGTFEDANAGMNKEVRIDSEDLFINGTNKNNYMVSIPTTTTATISPMPVTDPVITLEPDSYEYDGTEKKPDVKVFDEETEIDAREYIVSYSDNVETGTAAVTITNAEGGNYVVSGSTTFEITKRAVSVTPDALIKEYGTGDPTLTYEITSGSLAEGHTLTLSRLSGEDIGNYAIDQYTITDADGKDVSGNYDVTLADDVYFQITKPDLSTATVTLDQDSFIYDGTEHRPGVTVVKNGNTLVQDTDYTVTYADNTDAGTAKVTVTAVDGGNYYGFQTIEFKINPMDILNAEVDLGADPAYNGQEQTKTIRLTLGKTLAEGTDYQVSGNTGTNAGSYTLTVTGQGNYTGTLTRDWEITPCKLWAYAWNLSKIYDGTTAVTLTAGDATLRAGNYGIVDGDEVLLDTSGVTALFESADAGSGIAVSYTGTFALTGKDADNYVLAEQPDGITGTITRRQITVTPDAGQRVEYGQAMPELTYTIGGDGMAKDESLTGALSCDIGDGAVGEYAITRGSLAASENYDLSFTDGVMFEITRPDLATADVTLTLPDDGYIYDGAEKTPGITVVKDGVTVDPSEYTVSYINSNGGEGNHTNAGVVTVTITAVENGNYDGSNTATFAIQKANPAFSVSPDKADKTYGDEVFALAASHKSDGAVSYKSDNEAVAMVDETGTVTLHNAGEAVITVTLAETANYNGGEITITITVARKNDILTVDELTCEVVYGDGDFSIGYKTESGSKAAFTSSDTSVATVDADGMVQIVGVGTATITLNTEQSENYNAVSEAVTVTVQPKEITVTADGKTKVYGEDDPELTYTASGVLDGDDLNVALSRAEGEDAGEYDITADLTGANPNYAINFIPGTLTITQRAAQLLWSHTSLTYDGTAQKPAAVVSNLLAGDDCTVTVDGAQTDAGHYTAKAVRLSNGNYKLPEDAASAFTIAPKDIIAEITPNGGEYGAVTGAETKLTGVVEGDTVNVILTYTGTTNDGTAYNSTEVPTEAGNYTVAVGIDNANYSLNGAVAAEFSVARAGAQLSASPVPNKVYGDADFTLTENHKGDGAVTYASSNEDVATVDGDGNVTLLGAGDAAITVTLAQTANYEGGEISVTIKVEKAGDRLMVEKLAYEVTYGDADFLITPTTDSGSKVTFTSSDTSVATVDETGKVHIVGAGEAEITLETAESENYNAVSKIVTVTVKPKAIIVTADDLTKTYGEDDPELTWTAEGLVNGDILTDITVTRKDGEGVGIYTVTAAQKTGANPNYEIRFVNGVLTIQPKEITGAVVKLGAALIENGETQTQKIQSVTLQNSKGEAMDVTYTVTGNTGKGWGSYTMTITGTGNFTGSITRTFVIAPAANSVVKPAPDGEVEIGSGAIDAWVHHETGAPAVTLRTGEPEIIEMLTAGGHLTAEELSQVADGADIDIILKVADVSDTIGADSRAQIEKAASGYVIGRYLDISLHKQITMDGQTGELIPITGVLGDITISVEIPKELLNTDEAVTRTFWIIRNHDGVTDFLATTYDEAANTLTFTTDRFSDYAIVYQDARREADDDDSASSDGGSGGSAPLNTALGTVPPTGDDAALWLWMLLLLLACGGMAAVVFRGRRKFDY